MNLPPLLYNPLHPPEEIIFHPKDKLLKCVCSRCKSTASIKLNGQDQLLMCRCGRALLNIMESEKDKIANAC